MPSFTIKEIAKICKANFIGDENISISNFSIDSRKVDKDSLFVAIKGEKVDAHNFISQVYENSCRLCLVSRKDIELINGMSYIFVENTITALQDIAAYYRESLNIPIVAVTGSVGKTTTRQLIASALSAKYKTYQTIANSNSQVGVPLNILNITKDYEIAVIEMGISLPGEMTKIAKIVKPDVVAFTNISDTHTEFLKSKAGVLEEKFHIMDYMKKDSKIFVNACDKLLLSAKAYEGIEKINVFSIEDLNKKEEKYYVKSVEFEQDFPKFKASINHKDIECKLNIYGKHQISNVMLALAIADNFSVNLDEAVKNIEQQKTLNGRQNIIKKDSLIIVDDSYNASPLSMKAAIDILETFTTDNKKILVLADMKELGKEEIKLHEEIGEYILEKNSIDIVYTLGTLSRYIYDTIKNSNKFEKVLHFTNIKELSDDLKLSYKENCTLLFKGSNSMKLSEVISEYLA